MSAPPSIGTLDWKSATDHPELLAPPVADALGGAEYPAYVARIDPELADTAAFCAAYSVPLELSANCVIVAGRRADVSIMAACLVLAADRVAVNSTVRKRLGVRKISFAPMAGAVEVTGMAYGGITPIGVPSDWSILIDTSVAALDWMVVGSGIRGSKLIIPGRAAAALPGAEVISLAIG